MRTFFFARGVGGADGGAEDVDGGAEGVDGGAEGANGGAEGAGGGAEGVSDPGGPRATAVAITSVANDELVGRTAPGGDLVDDTARRRSREDGGEEARLARGRVWCRRTARKRREKHGAAVWGESGGGRGGGGEVRGLLGLDWLFLGEIGRNMGARLAVSRMGWRADAASADGVARQSRTKGEHSLAADSWRCSGPGRHKISVCRAQISASNLRQVPFFNALHGPYNPCPRPLSDSDSRSFGERSVSVPRLNLSSASKSFAPHLACPKTLPLFSRS